MNYVYSNVDCIETISFIKTEFSVFYCQIGDLNQINIKYVQHVMNITALA